MPQRYAVSLTQYFDKYIKEKNDLDKQYEEIYKTMFFRASIWKI